MTNYKFSDIVLLEYPFSELKTIKKRPALVLLDSGDDDLVISRITTKHYDTQYDFQLNDWRSAGLIAVSTVRLHKIATLGKNIIDKKLGSLSKRDIENIRLKFTSIYSLLH
ncbi:MAG: type II toxin-antitoxin system PemK/MazF family toxin [Ignavibacteriae bacterium]|nr:type II toxin-antitoxin system PemK/MazF family toxin [Ignavibacteriota bacterium]